MDTPRYRVIVWLFVLTLGCCLLQLGVFFFYFQTPSPDAAEYFHLGRNIARGEGYVTHLWMYPGIPKDDLPSPETYQEPLLPHLIGLSFYLFGINHFSAALFPLLATCFIPLITFLLASALNQKEARLVAAALAGFSPALVVMAGRAMSDVPSAALIGLFWFFCFKEKPWLAGLTAGLAYLTRTQATLAIGAGLVYLLWSTRSWKKVALAAGVFVLVCSPFFYRNWQLTGKLTSPDVRYFLLQSYYPLGTNAYFKTPPQFRLPLQIDSGTVARTSFRNLRGLTADGIPFVFGSFGAAWVCAVGLLSSPLRKQEWCLGLYLLLTIAIVIGISFESRYLISFVPLACVYTGAALVKIIRWLGRYPRTMWTLAVVLLVLVPGAQAIQLRRHEDSRWYARPYLQAARVGEFLQPRLEPGDAIMASPASYYNMAIDRNVVSFMSAPEEYLLGVCRRFRVRFVVTSEKEIEALQPQWKTGLPSWLRPLERIPSADVLIFHVDLEGYEINRESISCTDLGPSSNR